MKKTLLGGAMALALISSGQAATVGWNFSDLNAAFDTGSLAGTGLTLSDLSIGNSLGTVGTPVNSTSASSGYTGASGTGNIGNAMRTGSLNTGASGSGYIQFTIQTSSSAKVFRLTDLDFGVRSTGTGSQAYALRSSANNYASDIFTGTISNNSSWSLKNNSFSPYEVNALSGVTFRLYFYNGTGSPGSGTINTRLDDISLSFVTAVPEPHEYGLALAGMIAALVVIRRRRMANAQA